MDRFSFRKLRVYQRALDMTIATRPLTALIPRDQMDLRWQLQRAARSVVLNIAEGAGEFSPLEKARIYRIALRSGWETVSCLDIGLRSGFFAEHHTRDVEDLLDHVTGMLTKMIKGAEARAALRQSKRWRATRSERGANRSRSRSQKDKG